MVKHPGILGIFELDQQQLENNLNIEIWKYSCWRMINDYRSPYLDETTHFHLSDCKHPTKTQNIHVVNVTAIPNVLFQPIGWSWWLGDVTMVKDLIFHRFQDIGLIGYLNLETKHEVLRAKSWNPGDKGFQKFGGETHIWRIKTSKVETNLIFCDFEEY